MDEAGGAEVKHTKGMRSPYQPTKQEREDHERVHIPFRSWCAHCVRGKSKASGHKSVGDGGASRTKPIISMDYAYLSVPDGLAKDEKVKAEEKAEKEGHTPFFVMYDSESKSIYSYVAEHKGVNEQLCRRVVDTLDNIGYKEVVLKSDQEPAMLSFVEVVKASWDGDAALEASPVGESEANGAAERAIQTWKGQVRTMKDALETRIDSEIHPEDKVMTWLVEYAGSLIRRCLPGLDGRTPHEKIKGRASRRAVTEFGEQVWYRPLKVRSNSLAPIMESGVFVGIINQSDAALIAINSGVVKARDIRRQLAEDRWDKELVKGISTTPMEPTAGSADMRIKTYIKPGLANPEVPKRAADDAPAIAARRCRLVKKDFEDHGLTIACGGCRAISRRSSTSVTHSGQCRRRIEKELRKSADGAARLERADYRWNEALAEEVQKADAKRKCEGHDENKAAEESKREQEGMDEDTVMGEPATSSTAVVGRCRDLEGKERVHRHRQVLRPQAKDRGNARRLTARLLKMSPWRRIGSRSRRTKCPLRFSGIRTAAAPSCILRR